MIASSFFALAAYVSVEAVRALVGAREAGQSSVGIGLVALSLVVMFLIHTLQREEESLVFDCRQYCLEHLVNRIYEPEIASDGTGMSAGLGAPGMIGTPPGAIAGSLSQRAS